MNEPSTMKWLEIIELRSGLHAGKELQVVLSDIENKVNEDPKMPTLTIYKNFSLENDYSIHLDHGPSQPNKMGSLMGITIADTLKIFGLVSHEVWYERKLIL